MFIYFHLFTLNIAVLLFLSLLVGCKTHLGKRIGQESLAAFTCTLIVILTEIISKEDFSQLFTFDVVF